MASSTGTGNGVVEMDGQLRSSIGVWREESAAVDAGGVAGAADKHLDDTQARLRAVVADVLLVCREYWCSWSIRALADVANSAVELSEAAVMTALGEG